MISKLCSFFSTTRNQSEVVAIDHQLSGLGISAVSEVEPSTILHINQQSLETLLRDLRLPFGEFVVEIDYIERENIIDILDRISADRLNEVIGTV